MITISPTHRIVRRFSRHTLVLTMLVCVGSAPSARAAASYMVSYGFPMSDHTSGAPQRFQSVFTDANGAYSQDVYAIPGHVLASSLTQSVYGTSEVRATASGDDFLITGPGSGFQSVTVHFMLHLALDHDGPLVSNSIEGQGYFNFTVDYLGSPHTVNGTAFSGNVSSYGSGFLSTYSGGSVDVPVDIATSLPTGQPFKISLGVDGSSQAYGGYCTTRGQFSGDLGNAAGVVMDLPSGFTVNSVAWGVVNDQMVGTAAAPGPDAGLARLAWGRPSPNPSTGPATLAYTLPSHGVVDIAIVDLQGRIVRTLVHDEQGVGEHRVTWDGLGDDGHPSAAGMYLARLGFGGRSVVCRLARLR